MEILQPDLIKWRKHANVFSHFLHYHNACFAFHVSCNVVCMKLFSFMLRHDRCCSVKSEKVHIWRRLKVVEGSNKPGDPGSCPV